MAGRDERIGAARRLALAAAAGGVAGSLVGGVEALYILSRWSTGEYLALLFGVVSGGLAGALAGLVPGALLAAVRARRSAALDWSAAFNVVLIGFGGAVLRHHLVFDALREHPVPRSWDLALGIGAALVLPLGLWWAAILVGRTPLRLLLRARGAAVAAGTVWGLAALFAATPGPVRTDAALVPDPPATPPPEGAPDVVLLVLSGVRAGDLAAMPHLAALAGESVRFADVSAAAGWTGGAVASLWTATLPPAHGVLGDGDRLAAGRTLAEVFRDAGYATGAVVTDGGLVHGLGFGRGFDWYRFEGPRRVIGVSESAASLAVVRRLEEWLLARRRVGAGVVHGPTGPALRAARAFVEANREAGRRFLLAAQLSEAAPPWVGADGRVVASGPSVGAARAAALARLDAEVGAFLAWLDGRAGGDDVLVAVTADHGVELGEHGRVGDGLGLYEEVLRVPLLLRLPGRELAGWRVPWPARTVDVAPTLAARAGVAAPREWYGRDLLTGEVVGLLEDRAHGDLGGEVGPPPRPAVAVQDHRGAALATVRLGAWKLARALPDDPRGEPREALRDLDRDPGERRDLAGRRADRQAELSRLLREAVGEARARVGGGAPLSCSVCRRLLDLGTVADCERACRGPD